MPNKIIRSRKNDMELLDNINKNFVTTQVLFDLLHIFTRCLTLEQTQNL